MTDETGNAMLAADRLPTPPKAEAEKADGDNANGDANSDGGGQ